MVALTLLGELGLHRLFSTKQASSTAPDQLPLLKTVRVRVLVPLTGLPPPQAISPAIKAKVENHQRGFTANSI